MVKRYSSHDYTESETGWLVPKSDYDAMVGDRDQISLTLDVAKADRDKWFNRARALEAALTGLLARFIVLADAAVDPVYVERVPEVIAARGALSPTAETKGDAGG